MIITLGDTKFAIGPLKPLQARTVVPALLALAKRRVLQEGPKTPADFDDMAHVIRAALELHSLDAFWDLNASYPQMLEALPVIGHLAGLDVVAVWGDTPPTTPTLTDLVADSAQRLMADYPGGLVTSR